MFNLSSARPVGSGSGSRRAAYATATASAYLPGHDPPARSRPRARRGRLARRALLRVRRLQAWRPSRMRQVQRDWDVARRRLPGGAPGGDHAQGIGGRGHFGVQYASKMGFRTVAISSGADKERLARELGAHDDIDTAKTPAAEGLKKVGGADVILATAPHGAAIAAAVDGLRPRGKLELVEAPTVNPFALLLGRSLSGWSSGRPIRLGGHAALQRARGGSTPRRAVPAREGRGRVRPHDVEQGPLPRGPRPVALWRGGALVPAREGSPSAPQFRSGRSPPGCS